jgi:predicted alpha/beta hydrolase family esterase
LRALIIFGLRTWLNLLSFVAPRQAGALALKVFGTPRKGRLRDKDRQILKGAATRTLMHEHTPVATYEWPGVYGPVLLAHGWESNTARWRKMIEHLQKRKFGVVAFDAPAHGGTGGRTFSALEHAQMMDTVVTHYQPQAIVGHSVGGMATAYFLSHYQHSVIAAVLLAAPSDFMDIMDQYQQTLGFNQRVYNAMLKMVAEKFNIQTEAFNIPHFIKALGVAGLVIHDKTDRVTSFAGSEQIAAVWPGATFIATEGFGHSLNHRNVNGMVSAFLMTQIIEKEPEGETGK